MRSVRSILPLLLAAAGALVALSGGAVADHGGDWQEISPRHIIVNLAQATGAEIAWAQQAMPEGGVLLQEIGFVDPASGAEGYLFVRKNLDAPFLMESSDPALGGKAMHDMALSTLEDYAQDASVELIKKISVRDGVGHVAYVRGREVRCMIGQTAYNFEFQRAGSGRSFDTVVTLSYCDESGDSKRYVDFLKSLRLVSAADNRTAGADSSAEDPVTASGGSGFIVNPQGYILTNNHVIDGCAEVHAQLGEASARVAVVAADPWNDLALIRVSSSAPLDFALLREGRDAEVGEDVVAVGFPLPGLLASQPNVTVGTVSASAGLGNDVRFLQMTAPIQPGNSGGPLFDRSGNVVGVVVATLSLIELAEAIGKIPQNINFAIKASIVLNFLDTHGIGYRPPVWAASWTHPRSPTSGAA